MGKNKLHMIGKKTQKKKKKTKKLTKKDKHGIVDVPLARELSLGSKASLGSINYHYQKYYNTFAFLKEIIKKNKKLKSLVCIPDVGEGWMKSFLKVNFFKGISSKSMDSVKPVDSMNSKHKFISEIEQCMRNRLVPINLEIIVPGAGTHANVIIIDSHKKTVELFEPHGNRSVKSELESISRAYFKVSKNVQRFFSKFLPDFTYIPPSAYEPKEGLQARLDAFSGLCVTWSILYLHYRVLNPDVPPKKLINYLDKKITKNVLLRYTKYVEDVLKHKV
tara:strand:- start:710 stop:1540 length:831 start_codon:yes stop_codon:yes gene_type:complete